MTVRVKILALYLDRFFPSCASVIIQSPMLCPNCKTEYRDGFTRCSDCGAQLVEQLAAPVPTNRPQTADGPELLWTGSELPISGAITTALDKAGIPYHTRTRDVGLLPGLSQPVYAIFIPARHHAVAHSALDDALRQFEEGPSQADEDAAETESATESQEEDDATPDDIPGNYDPNEATAEVWSGGDADIKNMLIASLHENGIGCELTGEDNFAILVMPAAAQRAREIVREVIEASPPD